MSLASENCCLINTWIDWCCIYPSWVDNDDTVPLLWYDTRKVPVLLTLVEMGGLQYGEGPTKFVLKSFDGFGSYYTRDLCYGIIWGDKYFIRSILG